MEACGGAWNLDLGLDLARLLEVLDRGEMGLEKGR